MKRTRAISTRRTNIDRRGSTFVALAFTALASACAAGGSDATEFGATDGGGAVDAIGGDVGNNVESGSGGEASAASDAGGDGETFFDPDASDAMSSGNDAGGPMDAGLPPIDSGGPPPPPDSGGPPPLDAGLPHDSGGPPPADSGGPPPLDAGHAVDASLVGTCTSSPGCNMQGPSCTCGGQASDGTKTLQCDGVTCSCAENGVVYTTFPEPPSLCGFQTYGQYCCAP